MQTFQSISMAKCRPITIQTSSMLNWITRNIEKLNSSDGSSGMPSKLQEAIIWLILEKKTKDDIWISQNDITSALFCLEEKLSGRHYKAIKTYRTDAETNQALDSLLSEGVTLYRQYSGKKVFISIKEWTIQNHDMQSGIHHFLPLSTQLNLAQTCTTRYLLRGEYHF